MLAGVAIEGDYRPVSYEEVPGFPGTAKEKLVVKLLRHFVINGLLTPGAHATAADSEDGGVRDAVSAVDLAEHPEVGHANVKASLASVAAIDRVG